MTANPTPERLSQASRDTLDHIERHPTTHNLSWDDVLGLLRDIGHVEEESGGRYRFTLGDEHLVVSAPKHDAVDEQTVLSLHKLFKEAGYIEAKA